MARKFINLLLIEDNSDDALLMKEMLAAEAYGAFGEFHLEQVEYLSRGLEHLSKKKTDVVLLDLGLPDSMGIETLLNVHQHVPNLPIIVLTGLFDETVGVEAVQKGAQDYLVKGQIEGNLLKRSIHYAIERKKTEEKLRFLGVHDGLTGLYNRRYFDEELNRLKDDRSVPITLVICDIDGLKLINDTLGHVVGDQVIIAVAQVIRSAMREGNVVARIGGDEFAVVLPNADESVAKMVCDRILFEVTKYNQKTSGVAVNLSVGYAVKNTKTMTMYDLFREADNNMYRGKFYRSQSERGDMVQTVMKLLEVRDCATAMHSVRLQDLVSSLASKVGLSKKRIADICLLAKFHDIGKVGIPERILLKPGPLSTEEWQEIQRHPEIGYKIAQNSAEISTIADLVLKHHEWWNGKGYPLGLTGKDIPIECQILAIADAYDTMTSDRPYRKAMSHELAIAELKRCGGTQFDPELVEKFILFLNRVQRYNDNGIA